MDEPRVYLITGNEEIRNRNFIMENLLYHQKLKGANPLLVNFIRGNHFFSEEAVKPDKKEKTIPAFNYYTDMNIAAVEYEHILSGLTHKNPDTWFQAESDFSSIYLFGELGKECMYLYKAIDHIVLLIKNEYETSSYLFNFINKLYDKMIDKNINIIISDIKNIEDAAMFYVKRRDEMKEMIDESLVFDFLGFVELDVKKIAFTRRKQKLYIRIFFEDAFHGNLKYINEKMKGLEYFKADTLFKTIADGA